MLSDYVSERSTNSGSSFNSGYSGAASGTINWGQNNNNFNNGYSYPKSCREIYNNHQRGGAGTKLPNSVYSIKPDPDGNVIMVMKIENVFTDE